MSRPIEDYALIGDTETAALVARDTSIDWLCLPRFDSGACFAALLGDESHGRWRFGPAGPLEATRRRYRPGSLVLETELDTAQGTVRVIDAMPVRGIGHGRNPDLVRIVEGVRGRVDVRMDLTIRFDYGSIVPWVRRVDGRLRAVGGPDAVTLTTPVETRGEGLSTVCELAVAEGEQVPFVLTWHRSSEQAPEPVVAERALADTDGWWRDWSARSSYRGPWRDAVQRSLITLKALTFAPSGGIVAAPTTSLPESLGGARNWDYRFVWLRDATLTLHALLQGGYREEAAAWRDWLLRAVAGSPGDLQTMYGIVGERRLPELELPWLPGYEASRPVRVGNGAYDQIQLDVFGELMDALHAARRVGLDPEEDAWNLQRAVLDHLEGAWDTPDHGLWEVRGEPRPFTHSRVMSWVAFDRAVKTVERTSLDGSVDRWRRLREQIHAEVCAKGFDSELNTFTQSYGSRALDASLLLIPQLGFLPPDDERVLGTIDAIQHDLLVGDGLMLRYRLDHTDDGLSDDEGAFLLCSFWLVDALALAGRTDEARRRFEALLDLRNDVGLLAEEYAPSARRQLGNFPQAFSHIGLVDSACALTDLASSPARSRSEHPDARGDG